MWGWIVAAGLGVIVLAGGVYLLFVMIQLRTRV